MFLAVLHVSFETPTGLARKAAWEAQGLSVFHIMPTQAAHTAAREFPPEVVVVELADRPDFALGALRNVLAVPRRRGDQWPVVLAEVRPETREEAAGIAPHAILMPPGASPDEVLAACKGAIERNQAEWATAPRATGGNQAEWAAAPRATESNLAPWASAPLVGGNQA